MLIREKIVLFFKTGYIKSIFPKGILTVVLMLFFNVAAAQLTADFTIDKPSGCSPLAVQFTDASTGGPTSWQWNLGNGNTPTISNPATIYITPGTYNVTLTITKGVQTSTKTKTITVFQNPTSDFAASISKGCLPLNVFFSDQSVPGSAAIKTWFWDFGDGSNDNKQNPVHKYQQAGQYTVALIVTDNNGCTNTRSRANFITIDPSSTTILAFTGDNLSGCALPFTVNFANTSQPVGTTFLWNFGDGQTSSAVNPSHTYAASGSYKVYLVGTSAAGCSDTLKKNNYVNILNAPVANFTSNKAQACAFENVAFTNTSTPGSTKWHWSFGDGDTSDLQNPFHQFASSGTYTVSLTEDFGMNCTRSVSKNAFISVLPSGTTFTADKTTGCSIPLAVNFTDNTPSSNSWSWDFGDGISSALKSPSHSYSNYGKYTVSLVTTNSVNSCVDTSKKINYILLEKPIAAFKAFPRKGCVPLLVSFTDTSFSNEAIVSWNWDFGDGSTSTLQNPSHTFTSEQTYDITLVITNSAGCVDTVKRPGYIKAGFKPTFVGFSANKKIACASDYVQFTDASVHANGWFWDYGAGTDSLQNPNVQFKDTGTFTVKLTADFNGCQDSLIKQDYIKILPPVARFTPHQSCANANTVTLTDFSISPQTWKWDYGDGSPVSTSRYDTMHTYATRGFYNIKLITTNAGCIDSSITNVNIIAPKAIFSVPKFGCAPLNVAFTDQSLDAVSWIWYFGDGFSSTLKNPTHVYADTGSYNVALSVLDTLGCKDSLLINKYVKLGEIKADFVIDTTYGCIPLTVGFSDASTPSIGISTYKWDFGDGKTFTGKTPPPHVYTVAANYDVSLIISTANCIDTVTKSKIVQFPPSPSADFAISDTLTCKGTPVSFAITAPAPNLTYLWNFKDGGSSTFSTPSHTFATDGTFAVSLKVTDGNGCINTITKTVVIKDPVADFSATPRFASCPNLLANFTDKSSVNTVLWKWDFGDGTGSTLKNPSHLYTRTDSNDVRLIITTRLGCVDTLFLPNYIIIAGPKGDFFFDPFKGCPPLTVSFLSNTVNITKYQWDFGDGSQFGNGGSVQHDYQNPGVYHPRLIITDTSGCTLAFQSPDSIVVKLLTITAGNNKYICLKDSTTLDGTGEGNIFSWTPITGLSNPVIAAPKASPAITTTYFMKTKQGKCTSTDSVTVFVNPSFPTVNFSSGNVCLNDTTVFKDLSTISGPDKIKSWRWTFGDGAGSVVQDTSHRYVSPAIYNVSLTVVTDSGCVASATKPTQVYPLPKADFKSSGSCLKDVAQLTNLSTDVSGIKSQLWNMGDGAGASTSTNFYYTYADTGSYSIRLYVTSNNNCKDTVIKLFYVNPLPIAAFSSNRGACMQIPIQFNNLSTISRGTIVQWNWDFGDGKTATTKDPQNAYNTAGTFDVSLTATSDSGCKNTKSALSWITTIPIPKADFIIKPSVAQKLLQNKFNFYDRSSGAVASMWDFGDGDTSMLLNPEHFFGDTGVFYVTLTAIGKNGCPDTSVLKIHILPDFAFYISNAFTPNGDGYNDTFIGYGIGIEKFNMVIFDRWGNQLYETNSLKEPWDGRANGGKDIAQIDLYVYHIVLRDVFLETHTYTGHFSLIR